MFGGKSPTLWQLTSSWVTILWMCQGMLIEEELFAGEKTNNYIASAVFIFIIYQHKTSYFHHVTLKLTVIKLNQSKLFFCCIYFTPCRQVRRYFFWSCWIFTAFFNIYLWRFNNNINVSIWSCFGWLCYLLFSRWFGDTFSFSDGHSKFAKLFMFLNILIKKSIKVNDSRQKIIVTLLLSDSWHPLLLKWQSTGLKRQLISWLGFMLRNTTSGHPRLLRN